MLVQIQNGTDPPRIDALDNGSGLIAAAASHQHLHEDERMDCLDFRIDLRGQLFNLSVVVEVVGRLHDDDVGIDAQNLLFELALKACGHGQYNGQRSHPQDHPEHRYSREHAKNAQQREQHRRQEPRSECYDRQPGVAAAGKEDQGRNCRNQHAEPQPDQVASGSAPSIEVAPADLELIRHRLLPRRRSSSITRPHATLGSKERGLDAHGTSSLCHGAPAK